MSNGVTTKEYWDQYWGSGKPRYPDYDKTRGLFHSYDLLLAECIARTRTRLGQHRLRLVDCGCGEGLIMRFVCEQHPDVEAWGIEYSDAIEKARRMGEELGHDFHLIHGNLFELCRSGETGPFDIVISLGLVEHFENPRSVLADLARLVAPGGCIITIIPSFEGLFNFFWRTLDPANYRHHVPISDAALLDAHRALGLEDVRLYSLGPPTIPGIHAADARWQKLVNAVIVQVQGRVIQRFWPRQESLAQRHVLASTAACVGWMRGP